MKFSNLVPFTIKLYLTTFIVLVSFIVFFEFYNTRIHSIELAQDIRLIMQKSCRFMQQESFRGSGEETDTTPGKSFGNSYSIKDADGHDKVSGRFYVGSDMREVYNNLFINNEINYPEEFIEWLEPELQAKGFDSTTCAQGTSFEHLKKLMKNGTDDTGANSLASQLMITPANLGFTYLDPVVLKKIFKWKLVNRLTANSARISDYTKRNLIKEDENGPYVQWYGFRIYYDTIKINLTPSTQCHVYDINDEDDMEELQKWTGIDIERYRYGGDNEDSTNQVEGNRLADNDIRRYKILYDIRWEMKIGYEGILPIKQVMSLFNKEQDTKSIIMSDDESAYFSDYPNPLDINTPRSKPIKTTMNSDGQMQGNEMFNENPLTIGNDSSQMGNFEDGDYAYNKHNAHIGVSKEDNSDVAPGVLGLGQRMRYVVIY